MVSAIEEIHAPAQTAPERSEENTSLSAAYSAVKAVRQGNKPQPAGRGYRLFARD